MARTQSARALLLIHGSATDGASWAMLGRELGDRRKIDAPDRDPALTSVAAHADALEPLVTGETIAVGSSFGGVIALELARRFPGRVALVVALEPPAPVTPLSPAIPGGLGCLFDLAAAVGEPEVAAERFVRAVLGDRTYERIPAAFRARTLALWPAIRSDMRALAAHRFERLGEISTPVLLLRGARSPERFEASVAMLERELPDARTEVIAGAGHMMHIENARAVAAAINRFAAGAA